MKASNRNEQYVRADGQYKQRERNTNTLSKENRKHYNKWKMAFMGYLVNWIWLRKSDWIWQDKYFSLKNKEEK